MTMTPHDAYIEGFKQACARRGFDFDAVIKAAAQIDKFAQVIPVPTGTIPGMAQAQVPSGPARPQEAVQDATGAPDKVQDPSVLPSTMSLNNMGGLLMRQNQVPLPTNVGQGALAIGAGGQISPEEQVTDKGEPKPKPKVSDT